MGGGIFIFDDCDCDIELSDLSAVLIVLLAVGKFGEDSELVEACFGLDLNSISNRGLDLSTESEESSLSRRLTPRLPDPVEDVGLPEVV